MLNYQIPFIGMQMPWYIYKVEQFRSKINILQSEKNIPT